MFPQKEFGYNRKDVILIGVGVTLLGYGLKSGLEVTYFCVSSSSSLAAAPLVYASITEAFSP